MGMPFDPTRHDRQGGEIVGRLLDGRIDSHDARSLDHDLGVVRHAAFSVQERARPNGDLVLRREQARISTNAAIKIGRRFM